MRGESAVDTRFDTGYAHEGFHSGGRLLIVADDATTSLHGFQHGFLNFQYHLRCRRHDIYDIDATRHARVICSLRQAEAEFS